MSKEKDAKEQKDRFVQEMGDKLGSMFYHLRVEVTWLATNWHEYKELFATNPERVKLLNASAGGFFNMLQLLLYDQTLLRIARLTDRPGDGKAKRLTLRRLPNVVSPEIKAAVEEKLTEIDDKVEFCRDHRHRRIAHNNLELLTSESATPLEAGTLEKVNAAIKAIEDLLKQVALHHLGSDMSFIIYRSTGATLIMRRLQTALNAEREVKEAMARGEMPRSNILQTKIP